MLLTKDLITQRASWRDLSASSMTNGFEPLTRTDTVFDYFRPVILKILESSRSLACSQRAAWPNLSSVMWSIWAIGMAVIDLQMKSMSYLSTSCTTMIPFLAKKWRESSLVASFKILFWIKRTLAPDAAIFLTIPAIIFLSYFMILSIAW